MIEPAGAACTPCGRRRSGEPPESILTDFPSLERADISACLADAARRVDHPRLAARPSAGAIRVDAQRPPRLARWPNGRGERQALHVFDAPLAMITSSDVAIVERRWSAVQALLDAGECLVESG